MKAWKYTLAYLIPMSVLFGYGIGGHFTFLTPVLVFVLVPLLDFALGKDKQNPPPQEMERLENQPGFRLVLYLYVPVQLTLLLLTAYAVATGRFSTAEKIGLTLSVGIMTGGIGITIAHELTHKKRLFDRTLGKFLLLMVSYMHFYIEHNLGHHTNVATTKDPATARAGESIYAFYPRTLLGSLKNAWRIEKQRLHRAGRSRFSMRNQMLWFLVLPCVFAAGLAWLWGKEAVLFYFAQSFVAFMLLETINYVEHYGLVRGKTSSGRYEQVTAAHSWDADQRLTNYLLFKLQRHADHHMHPVKQYQTLRHYEESPKLPTGYAGMVLLALLPPLWYKIMHPRLKGFQKQSAVT